MSTQKPLRPGRSARSRAAMTAGALGVLVMSLAVSGIAPLAAAQPFESPATRAAREDAIRSLPVDKLDQPTRAAVLQVVNNASFFRRMPTQVIDCDPQMHLFLVRHPEVIVNMWSVMGVSNVAMERTGPSTYRASDGAGTTGSVKYCYSDHDTHVVYAEGRYEGALFTKPLQARCVLILRTAGLRETNGRYFITNRLDSFIQIQNVGWEFIAKTFQPLVTKSADYNFSETAAFVSNVSRTAEANPAGMLRLAGKLQAVEPAVRQQFSAVTVAVSQRPAERAAQRATPGRVVAASSNAAEE